MCIALARLAIDPSAKPRKRLLLTHFLGTLLCSLSPLGITVDHN
jgi:hypothetical protein